MEERGEGMGEEPSFRWLLRNLVAEKGKARERERERERERG